MTVDFGPDCYGLASQADELLVWTFVLKMLLVVLLFSKNRAVFAAATDFRPQALAHVALCVIDVERFITFRTLQDELVVLSLVGRVHLFCGGVVSVRVLLLALRIRASVVRL